MNNYLILTYSICEVVCDFCGHTKKNIQTGIYGVAAQLKKTKSLRGCVGWTFTFLSFDLLAVMLVVRPLLSEIILLIMIDH